MINECWINYITWLSIVSGIASSVSWFRACFVKITREQEAAWRRRKAKKSGDKVNLAGVTLDGWDMSGTFRVQSKWNALGAFFAACAVMLQALIKIFENL